jgi:NADPH-dependent 2,4-dienoyl-CoA reductase/sulfur reductase-like enzyme
VDPERLVVIGADAAGMSAAHQALRTAKTTGRLLEVVALERTQHTSYSACGIPYWVAGDVDQADDLVARTPAEHHALGVDLRTGMTATGVDLTERTVAYLDREGAALSLAFDQLVIATGARPIVPEWALGPDGSPHGGVGPVKNLDDGAAWISRFVRRFTEPGDATRGRVVIAGGGYLGVEMAEVALRRGCAVTLLTRSKVMSSLDPDLSDRIRSGLQQAGAVVVENAVVDGLTVSDGWVRTVHTAGGDAYPCDLLVVALGVAPVTEFLTGLALGDSGGLLADPRGAVAPGVWAAGDCCEVRHRLTESWTYLPLGTHANKAGRVVGSNLAGGSLRFDGVLGTAITRFAYGDVHLEISRTGLSSAEAAGAGIRATALVTEGTTSSGYMPEAAPIAIKVLAEPGTRRLLGVQIVGGPGAGKRIDAAAAALWGGMSVDELAWMDLSYAPPFATAWEILQVAARRLAERL